MSSPSASEDGFADVARALRNEHGEVDTMDRAVEAAVSIVDGCDAAAISLIRGHERVETLNASSEAARRADELQYDLHDGPCLTAIRDQETTWIADLTHEPRWPTWSGVVSRDFGFHSALCFRLFVTDRDYGALNLYSEHVDAFTARDHEVGLALAAHIAVALASSKDIEQLTDSIHRRGTIGVALGIVMERYDLDQRAAFLFLRRVSETTNTRVFDLAVQISTTRQMPLQGGPTATG